MASPACREPFERGPKLCSICRLAPAPSGVGKCSRMVAGSPAMQALLSRALPIAQSEAPVVLTGESGTGKEVLARLLHANSGRREKPFVAVNVAALPAELLESELFGHVRGAFTGAVTQRRGLMEAAHKGTLFLDEIGEMPAAMQAKLLRALQDGEIRPVGGTETHRADVRVVCATHRDLPGLIEQGRFREDLYYRLKVFALHLPPLRERGEDILRLVQLFLEQQGAPGAALSPETRRALLSHPWPGNVRELSNAVVHAVALARGGELRPEHLPEDVVRPRKATRAGVELRPLHAVEREHVLRVLEACGGNQVSAAKVLGIGRNTLWRKLRAWE